MKKEHLCVIVLVQVAFLCLCLLPSVDAASCFACAVSKAGTACESNSARLLKYKNKYGTSNKWSPYVKNCSSSKDLVYCSIESISKKGETLSFIRDCSDGQSFSLPTERHKRLQPDNHTICAFTDKEYQVCITVCAGDYCNGPASAHMTSPFIPLLIGLLLICAMLTAHTKY